MNIKLVLLIVITVFGVLTGGESLQAANQARPPITWEVLPYVFFGSMFMLFAVVAIQASREHKKYGLWAINAMAACTIYFVATGAAAALMASQLSPASLLFLTVGLGGAIGVSGSWYFFRVRHLNKRL